MKIKLILGIVSFLAIGCGSQQKAAEAVRLENTYWKLAEVDGTLVTTPADGREVHMMLIRESDKGVLKGHAGCNALGGDYSVDGATIKFEPILTRMYCESQMDIENRLSRMLSVADNFRIEGNVLELYVGDDLLGKFEAQVGRRGMQ